jgi:hypothetical protein
MFFVSRFRMGKLEVSCCSCGVVEVSDKTRGVQTFLLDGGEAWYQIREDVGADGNAHPLQKTPSVPILHHVFSQ